MFVEDCMTGDQKLCCNAFLISLFSVMYSKSYFGVGVPKFRQKKIKSCKSTCRLFESHSYLTGVTVAKWYIMLTSVGVFIMQDTAKMRDIYLRRHHMETFPALLAICAANSPVTVTELWFFFNLRLNKQLSKHGWGWWFETPSRPLWRHCNVLCYSYATVLLFI